MTGRTNTGKVRTQKRSRRKGYKRLYASILVAVMIVCCSVIMLHKTISSASNEPHLEKCYKSIEIQPGDSLWSIASKYYTEDWEDITMFMNEIKEFNGISNDVIHAGNYIAIPYIVEVE